MKRQQKSPFSRLLHVKCHELQLFFRANRAKESGDGGLLGTDHVEVAT